MNIFEPKDASVSKIIKPINENIINALAQQCLQIKKDDDMYNLYSKFYETRYSVVDLSLKEMQLNGYLQQLHTKYGNMVRTDLQNSEYCWVKVNTSQMGDIAYRYYLAPNPDNMHEIVKNLTTKFAENSVPVRFKYQLQQKMSECDRIIIYSDFEHRNQVEAQIKNVYDNNPRLFNNSERAISWIYDSQTPNVFFAPETPGSSYGQVFAEIMSQAKQIFCYLYGITDTNNKISLNGDDATQALEYMKLIVCSLLFRNGLLLSNDGRKITVKDKNIRTDYDYKTGVLTNTHQDNTGYYRVTFAPTIEGKNALLKNFYNVSQVQSQSGITVEHLTAEQRKEELYVALYGAKAQQYLQAEASKRPHR